MKCNLCPNNCNVDRSLSVGRCGVNEQLKIAKYAPFFYEEPLISGTKGSGAIFFCGCSLKCRFCQNYPLSRNQTGKTITQTEFTDIVKQLEKEGVHNINLVNPTHYVYELKSAFSAYRPSIPTVYNTHGYETLKTLDITNDFVDIYLADLKFFSPSRSERYCGKNDYYEVAEKAVLKMVESKPLTVENGIMKQGVIVRHLILPQNVDDTLKIIDNYAEKIGDKAYFSLMSQYTPYGDIREFKELERPITSMEYSRATQRLLSKRLKNVFLQEKTSASETYIPKWDY